MNPSQKVVCCCRRGQVRSLAARSILVEMGFQKVLCCGLENNDRETVRNLLTWADVVLVVGSQGVFRLFREYADIEELYYGIAFHRIDVGQDVWGDYRSKELQGLLRPHLERLVKE